MGQLMLLCVCVLRRFVTCLIRQAPEDIVPWKNPPIPMIIPSLFLIVILLD